MSKFSRVHYTRLAEFVADDLHGYFTFEQRRLLAERMVDMLKEDNPGFKPDAFLAACRSGGKA